MCVERYTHTLVDCRQYCPAGPRGSLWGVPVPRMVASSFSLPLGFVNSGIPQGLAPWQEARSIKALCNEARDSLLTSACFGCRSARLQGGLMPRYFPPTHFVAHQNINSMRIKILFWSQDCISPLLAPHRSLQEVLTLEQCQHSEITAQSVDTGQIQTGVGVGWGFEVYVGLQ